MPYADPDIRRERTRERVRQYRERHADDPDYLRRKREEKRRYVRAHPEKRKSAQRPFIGIDGEGGGTDELGRQNYLLLHAAYHQGRQRFHRELFNDNTPLSPPDCMDFILALPANAIIVGYFFGYDATQILKGLPLDKLKDILADREIVPGVSPWTYWKNYAIDYRPRQYLRIARVVDGTGGRPFVLKGSSRTVNEVGGFFQKSFVESLKSWEIATPAELERIAAGKERRSEFVTMTEIERAYCASECVLLAKLMETFRETCRDAGILPQNWRGAGTLAAALHRQHETPRRRDLSPRKEGLADMAINAYYGGRFEVMHIGHIPGPVYEYDICSAYPAAMLDLPCPLHTTWRRFRHEPPHPDRQLFVAAVDFTHDPDAPLCCFPFRRQGRLFWPRIGSGTYWSPEIMAADRMGAGITLRGGWYAVRKCKCHPYDWVRELYAYRQQIGKGAKGYPIKLGLNSLYGKFAQRQGEAPYRDMIAAGLITAITRAKLLNACHGRENAIVMLATDAVFSREPLQLDFGTGLGQWEADERKGGLFIVMPGVYWEPGSDRLPKTRGIPRSQIIARRNDFETLWNDWARGDGSDDYPAIEVGLTTFYGHRLALARGKPWLAGMWADVNKRISFDWSGKRAADGMPVAGRVVTRPIRGWLGAQSEPFDPAALTDATETALMVEANPDFTPLGNQGE